jgi:hypothetical protein
MAPWTKDLISRAARKTPRKVNVTNDITHDRIMELAMGFCASKTLLSAVEIGVFGAFGEGPLDLASPARF